MLLPPPPPPSPPRYVAIIVPFFIIEICGITAYILTDNAIQVGGNGGADLILAGLLPMYAFTNALQILSAATGDASGKNGVRLTLGGLGGDGIYAPITAALWTLLFDFVLYTFLFVYCDMVLPVGPGVKHHPLFFLKREVITSRGGSNEADQLRWRVTATCSLRSLLVALLPASSLLIACSDLSTARPQPTPSRAVSSFGSPRAP